MRLPRKKEARRSNTRSQYKDLFYSHNHWIPVSMDTWWKIAKPARKRRNREWKNWFSKRRVADKRDCDALHSGSEVDGPVPRPGKDRTNREYRIRTSYFPQWGRMTWKISAHVPMTQCQWRFSFIFLSELKNEKPGSTSLFRGTRIWHNLLHYLIILSH